MDDKNDQHLRLNSDLDKIVADFFGASFNSFRETLFPWFLFAISKRGSHFKNLSQKDFTLFKEHFNQLLEDLYHSGDIADRYDPIGKEDAQ